ncbi:hypothetical protein HK100_000219 [Physocladia obscura]|uniref:DUF2415 domain-containing protein n=1 Tax=Physocladia obscura TaxID=109957 RepID=A0AAD5SZ13_9FUNG|nr:hypothetical protein HK100_000219 [Physocladia obscura]
MCISQYANQPRLFICNNDETIKIYTLPGLQRITSIQLPTAVNYASVSPDGKKLCAVGDNNQVFLYDVTGQGGYTKISTLTATTDACFSCAWNHSSDKFAVACQDGFVCVWDVRSTEKLAKISTKQVYTIYNVYYLFCQLSNYNFQNPQVKGAARCVKFSMSGSVDLMMFTELTIHFQHVSYMNIVDARTFNDTQSIRVAPANSDQHISGIACSPDSRSIFVGLENVVLEYDIDVIARRSFGEGSLV